MAWTVEVQHRRVLRLVVERLLLGDKVTYSVAAGALQNCRVRCFPRFRFEDRMQIHSEQYSRTFAESLRDALAEWRRRKPAVARQHGIDELGVVPESDTLAS